MSRFFSSSSQPLLCKGTSMCTPYWWTKKEFTAIILTLTHTKSCLSGFNELLSLYCKFVDNYSKNIKLQENSEWQEYAIMEN